MQSDAIIIGSGPSGVSAAVPLVEAGWNVTMLDAADAREELAIPSSLSALRSDPAQWRPLLGSDLSVFADDGNSSPKLRTGPALAASRHYAEANLIRPENFRLFGMCSAGGSSRIWGAVSTPFGPEELDRLSLPAADMADSYRRVASRIGLSGDAGDDLAVETESNLPLDPAPALHPAAARIFASYREKAARARASGFRLGRPRHAVLTRDRTARAGCNGCGACLWGCARGSIYSSAMDLARLRTFPNFLYRDKFTVTRLERAGERWVAISDDGASASGSVLVLAAGVPATTRLALTTLGKYDFDVPLLTNPVMATAMIVPRELGRPAPQPPGFAMAQLAYRLDLGDRSGEAAVGAVYATEGLPAFELLRSSALTRPAALAAFRTLRQAVLLAICFFPGRLSKNSASVRRIDNHLVIRGAHAAELFGTARRVREKLSSMFRRLGAYAMPGAATIAQPGSDLHYAGTLPIGTMTAQDGQLKGAERLYVADASVLPHLPATHCTFTVMANADRIMRSLAARGRPIASST